MTFFLQEWYNDAIAQPVQNRNMTVEELTWAARRYTTLTPTFSVSTSTGTAAVSTQALSIITDRRAWSAPIIDTVARPSLFPPVSSVPTLLDLIPAGTLQAQPLQARPLQTGPLLFEATMFGQSELGRTLTRHTPLWQVRVISV